MDCIYFIKFYLVFFCYKQINVSSNDQILMQVRKSTFPNDQEVLPILKHFQTQLHYPILAGNISSFHSFFTEKKRKNTIN